MSDFMLANGRPCIAVDGELFKTMTALLRAQADQWEYILPILSPAQLADPGVRERMGKVRALASKSAEINGAFLADQIPERMNQ